MHHTLGLDALEQRGHAGAVGDVELLKGKAVAIGQPGQAGLLEAHVVVVVEVVQPDDRVTAVEQPRRQRRANETGGAGDQNPHAYSLELMGGPHRGRARYGSDYACRDTPLQPGQRRRPRWPVHPRGNARFSSDVLTYPQGWKTKIFFTPAGFIDSNAGRSADSRAGTRGYRFFHRAYPQAVHRLLRTFPQAAH